MCCNTYYPAMARERRDETLPGKRSPGIHQEAHLALHRTAGLLDDAMLRIFKAHGISSVQYNVLRILRGSGPDGLCRNEVRDRLLTRMPDVTRLLDRMEHAGLIERERSTVDRRQVATRLTAKGRALVDSLDKPVADEQRRLLGQLPAKDLKALVLLLGEVRDACTGHD